MKKSTLLFAALLLISTSAHALVVNVTGHEQVPATGLVITINETEIDPLTEKPLMSVTGTVQSTDSLRVTITRSAAGLVDEFCCAGICLAGNQALTQQLTFAPTAEGQWFVHYTPAEESYETITYLFKDGDETRIVTVHFDNGGEPRPTSFPRKHLIEEFTGQGCGWCPGGMDNVHAFIADDPNWILVMHHTYTDNFTISNSNVIANKLGVNGAPYVTIDRAKVNYGEGVSTIFHPGYLPATAKTQFDTTTYASIQLENNYDSLTRELKVKVSGLVLDTAKKNLKLTVIVKESGMIAYQADFVNGNWAQFRHTNAVRVFMTSANGKTFDLDSTQHYALELTTTLNSKWVPENCMVVAWMAENFKPVVQAAELPVVEGTTGGADIQHGGIDDMEAVEEVNHHTSSNRKFLQDGQLLIERQGQLFNTTGQLLQ
ncbi:MAG: Omp28-related outer membrane protein [Paludibacteraceae bacterium]|nr:Omp28-related outer membrane protein [Paludibacteraceae bacterium]